MATVVDFEDLNPGAWFEFGVGKGKKGRGKDAATRVKIRAYSEAFMDGVRDECVDTRVEYKKTSKRGDLQRFEVTDVDDRRFKEMLWDHVIMDWEGFVDKAKSPIPCTTENKIKFMSGWPKFYQFVDDCLEKLTPDVAKIVEDEAKN